MGLGDFASAAKLRDLVADISGKYLEATRPKYRYATVVSIDRTNKKATVRYPEDAVDVMTVRFGSVVPMYAGQVVRVDGYLGDRYISEVVTGLSERAGRYSMPPLVTEDTTWNEVTVFDNGWVNYDLGTVFNSVAYRKDRFGFVHLKGLIRAGTGINIFTLPVGYRPFKGRHLFLTVSNTSLAYIQISLNGIVTVVYGGSGSNAYVTLDNIMFPTWDDYDLRLVPDYGTTINSFGSDLTQDQDMPAWFYDVLNKHVYGLNQIYAGSFSGSTVVSRHAGLLPIAYSQGIYAIYNQNGATATWMEWRVNGDSFGGNTLFQNQGNPVTFAIPKMIIWPTQEAAKLYTPATFANSWTDYLPHERQFGPAGYYKDYAGRVHLKGLIKQTSGAGNANISGGTLPSFTLPVGYRPLRRYLFPSFGGNSFARTDVLPNGNVLVETGNQAYHSLSGIYFYAEQ